MHPDLRAIETPPHGLIRARDSAALGVDRELRASLKRREIVRVRTGIYVRQETWHETDAATRHRMRVEAFALKHESARHVHTHHSAAALWGLPTIHEWPAIIHVTASTPGRGRTKGDTHEHPLPDGVRIVTHDGFALTSVADTVVALACVLPFADAVAIADYALHVPRGGVALCTQAQLRLSLGTYRGRNGFRSAQAVVAFADGRSGSVGESHSRANMHLCGFVLPELQVRFADADGLIGFTDFFWRSINRIGEFDGLGKYLREEFAHGLDPADAVIAEKIREDRLRGCGPAVSRWLWDRATSPRKLGEFLHREGVPLAA